MNNSTQCGNLQEHVTRHSKMDMMSHLNTLLSRGLFGNDELYFYEVFSNTRDFALQRISVKSHTEVGIVLQGGIDNIDLLEFTLERYCKAYPDSKKIVSSWQDTNHQYVQRLVSLKRKYPNIHLTLSPKPQYSGHVNTNLQIISTKKGLEVALQLGCRTVLKQRTDQVFCNICFLDYLAILHQLFDKQCSPGQSMRIVVGSMGSLRARPFSVSDFFSFGLIDDMIKMWDLLIATSDDDIRNVYVRPPSANDRIPMEPGDIPHLKWSTSESRSAEPYIISNLLDRSSYGFSYDWHDSNCFLAQCFIVADCSFLGLNWPKYGWSNSNSKYTTGHAFCKEFSASRWRMTEIAFVDWIGLYLEYLMAFGGAEDLAGILQ